MELANETLVSASGWAKHDPESINPNQAYLDHCHRVAKIFGTSDGQEVLKVMVHDFLLQDVVTASDNQFSAGIKQGQAKIVKRILAQIETSNNTKT